MAKESAKKVAQNKKNLKPGNHKLTVEEAKKGGKKSAAVQRRRRNMREDIKSLLSMPLEPELLKDIEGLRALSELENSNVTAQEAMLYQLLLRGIKKGDKEAIKLIYEMSGDNKEETTDNDMVLAFIRSITE